MSTLDLNFAFLFSGAQNLCDVVMSDGETTDTRKNNTDDDVSIVILLPEMKFYLKIKFLFLNEFV